MQLKVIAEILAERSGRQFDIPFRKQCEDLVVFWRARLLTNSLSKDQSKKSYYSQSILVPLKSVSREDKDEQCSDECEELKECGCENIYRSVDKIPQTLKLSNNPFDYVGSPAGHKSFTYTTFGQEFYRVYSKYTGKKPRYTYINDYIYIFNEKNIDKLRVEGIFGDPRKLNNFVCSDGTGLKCYSETSDFPIDEATIQLIIQSALSTELRIIPVEEKTEIKADTNV